MTTGAAENGQGCPKTGGKLRTDKRYGSKLQDANIQVASSGREAKEESREKRSGKSEESLQWLSCRGRTKTVRIAGAGLESY